MMSADIKDVERDDVDDDDLSYSGDDDASTPSTSTGRNTLFQCARNKDDEVYERIISTDSEKKFLYHSGNLCYKPYILVKPDPKQTTVEGIDDDDDASTETECCSWERKLRSPDTLREAASSKRNPSDMKCVICNQVTKNKVRKKFRLEWDSRTDNFVAVAKKRLDDVYGRIADCINAKRIWGADIYYHGNCMRGYVRESEEPKKSESVPESANNEE